MTASGPRLVEQPTIERPLPRNLDAERSVLGAVLLDNKALNAAAAIVKPEDFFDDHHRPIFATMLELGAAQRVVDLVTLADRMHRKGELEAAGGAAYISQLVDGVPRVTHLEHYARIVRDKSRLRGVIRASHLATERAYAEQEDADSIVGRARLDFGILAEQRAAADIFDTIEEFDSTPEATFSIPGFLQDYAVNALAALSGHGKTWLACDVAAALLFGPGKLWNHFEVTGRATKVVYLIPEASRSTFKTRLKLMKLYEEIGKRLFVRTLTKGPTISLADPDLLREVKDAHVICDTAIRFLKSDDDNSAGEVSALSEDFFALQRAGAKSVIPLFHSPKSFETQTHMSLENMIRGSSEFGAVLATGWGLRQIDPQTNTVYVSNIKARDFQPCESFQLIGRPHIDQEGSFAMLLRPGECGSLSAYLDVKNRGGATEAVKQAKAANLEVLRQMLAKEPGLSSSELEKRFSAIGVDVDGSTIRKYRKELGL